MNTEHQSISTSGELAATHFLDLSPQKISDLEQTSRGEPLTWGATPLQPYREDVAAQQRFVRTEIGKLFPESPRQVPFDLHWDTARYIEDNFIMRTQRRMSRNYDSYQYRGISDPTQIPLQALGFVDRSLAGHASPAEIIATADVEQIPTAELASLSHPYAKRIELLAPMRAALQEGILFHDGTIVESQPSLKVKHANYLTAEYEAFEPTLLMTRTVCIGKIGEDIDVMERSSFNVILSRIAPELVESITDIQYSETWSKDILGLPGFEKKVFTALENNDYDVAVPVSTTAFEVNKKLVKELLENKQHKERRQLQMTRHAIANSGKASLI
jgi:hypothetical protein